MDAAYLGVLGNSAAGLQDWLVAAAAEQQESALEAHFVSEHKAGMHVILHSAASSAGKLKAMWRFKTAAFLRDANAWPVNQVFDVT